MISFEYMAKSEADELLPRLFELLYENMNEIAPSGLSEEEELPGWLDAVGSAVQKEARQIVLIKDVEELVGYFQYFINDTTFMMEEIQFKRVYQGSGMFNELYAFLYETIKTFPEGVEAYSHKDNLKSQGILEHLGLSRIGENKNGSCFHYRGSCETMWKRLGLR
ncbi:MAG: hypothetical protein IKZ82_08895 [Clostridia bacterium]|nr:hypothetical protein [Clostridia bacterium]